MPALPISRRAVLAGGAGLVLATACGSSGSTSSDTTTADGTKVSGRVLIAYFDGSTTLVSGSPQRVTFGIGDSSGAPILDGPKTLDFTVTRQGGSSIGPIKVASHHAGLQRAYYPITFTPQAAGTYEAVAMVDGEKLSSAFSIGRTDDVSIPGAGDPMPVVDTPTTTDPRGIDPICTREPACGLHTVDLKDAVGAHAKPTALIISTPAYCQTAICGPVLDLVLAAQSKFPGITFIHAEVYRSAKDVEANGANAKLAPVLDALHLTFEPVLFLIGKDGTIVQRLDVIFDAVELHEALRGLQA